jgi:hypothetical protein
MIQIRLVQKSHILVGHLIDILMKPSNSFAQANEGQPLQIHRMIMPKGKDSSIKSIRAGGATEAASSNQSCGGATEDIDDNIHVSPAQLNRYFDSTHGVFPL